MWKTLNRFIKDDRGNIALLAGVSAMPLVVLAAGAIETSMITGTRQSMQATADSAILAALNAKGRDKALRWEQRQDVANALMLANLVENRSLTNVTGSLTGVRKGRAVYVTFEAKGDVKSYFGKLSPIAHKKLKVKSQVEVSPRTGNLPLLVTKQDGFAGQE